MTAFHCEQQAVRRQGVTGLQRAGMTIIGRREKNDHRCAVEVCHGRAVSKQKRQSASHLFHDKSRALRISGLHLLSLLIVTHRGERDQQSGALLCGGLSWSQASADRGRSGHCARARVGCCKDQALLPKPDGTGTTWTGGLSLMRFGSPQSTRRGGVSRQGARDHAGRQAKRVRVARRHVDLAPGAMSGWHGAAAAEGAPHHPFGVALEVLSQRSAAHGRQPNVTQGGESRQLRVRRRWGWRRRRRRWRAGGATSGRWRREW